MSQNITIKTTEPMHVMSMRRKTNQQGIGQSFMEMLPATFEYVVTHGGQPAGPPFGRYHSYSPEDIDLEAGIPVAAPVAGSSDVQASEIPGAEVASIEHWGSYDNLIETWNKIQNWIPENGYEYAAPPYEIFWTDPGSEPDSSKWRTEIVWPIKKK